MARTNINKICVGWITNFGKEYNKVMMAIPNKNMDMEVAIFVLLVAINFRPIDIEIYGIKI